MLYNALTNETLL